jgi:hypothetical protein
LVELCITQILIRLRQKQVDCSGILLLPSRVDEKRPKKEEESTKMVKRMVVSTSNLRSDPKQLDNAIRFS